jgi:hypothetical protein
MNASQILQLSCLSAVVLVTMASGASSPAGGSLAGADEHSGRGRAQTAAFAYEWFNEGTPAGEQSVLSTEDGLIVSNMRIRWNNREFILRNELELDESGFVVAQKLTGTSAFGATIQEEFNWTGDVASWHSPAESGSAQLSSPAFYVPARTGATESIAALIRAGLSAPEQTLALLPAGEARITEIAKTRVENGELSKNVTLYAVTGLGFSPTYAWLDDDLNLFAFGFWSLSMVPKGWGYKTLERLQALQSKHESYHYERIAQRHSEAITQPLLIRNVDVVDVNSGALIRGHDVLIENGVITQIGVNPLEANDARIIDGAGKTLMPGLWDMHAHTDFYPHYGGILNIASGVTSVRDMGSDHDKLSSAGGAFESGRLVGPRVYRAGFIDQSSPYAAARAVESLIEAKEKVLWYADRGYLQIKLYSSISPEWVAPLARLAHENGLRVSGHVPAFMSAEQAVLDGFDEIQHINMLFLNFLADAETDTRTQVRFHLYGDKAGTVDLESDKVGDFIKLLVERKIVVDPTIAVFDSMIGHRAGDANPMFRKVIDRFPIGEYRTHHSPAMETTEDNVPNWEKSRSKALEMLAKLYVSGVQIVAGTDALPGFALHRELELYTESGIPAAAALRIATLDAAGVAGVDAISGSIAIGKQADLVMVDGNPLEDISAIRRPVLVLKGDRIFWPNELLRALGIRPAHEAH